MARLAEGGAVADWDASRQTGFGEITDTCVFAAWVAKDILPIRHRAQIRRARLDRLFGPHKVNRAGQRQTREPAKPDREHSWNPRSGLGFQLCCAALDAFS